MSLHFPTSEFDSRIAKTCHALDTLGLDGLVVFRQESMYYLTGYDSDGFAMFQGMVLTVDGRLALLTRSADRLQSRMTSTLGDIRIWEDSEDASPGIDLRDMMGSLGLQGKRVAIEYHAYGLTAQRGKMVDAALEGFCKTLDGSDIVRLIRLVKSPLELDYVRKAGQLCDDAWAIANRDTRPGAFLGAVYGDMMRVIMAGDGDPSAHRWPMGAGENALMVRYHTGKETVAAQDQVTHEFGAAYRHYHGVAMSVVVTGKPDQRHKDMFAACKEALALCHETLRPGNTVGELYEAHASEFSRHGYGHAALGACGYSLGISYPPSWMDWPMIYRGNTQVIESGMVFFMHMILLDDTTGLSMSLGETAIVTEGVPERINHAPAELIVN